MPLSRPYGVTRPVVGQMFHVKHSLWHRWCSGRRRPRLWGRAAVCAGGRRPAREPSAPRASLGASPRSPARPRRRPRAPQPGPLVPFGPSGALHTGGTWCAGVWLAVPRHRPPVPRPGPDTAYGHRDGMQKVRSPCGSADLRGTPAVPEFAQWRSAFTRCLASASSLS